MTARRDILVGLASIAGGIILITLGLGEVSLEKLSKVLGIFFIVFGGIIIIMVLLKSFFEGMLGQ
jgi:hypothetical protein